MTDALKIGIDIHVTGEEPTADTPHPRAGGTRPCASADNWQDTIGLTE